MSRRVDDLKLGNLKIIQDTDFFEFGTDSVLLANYAKSNSQKKVVLDLCSGSGVIPIIFSYKNKFDKIITVELQDEMYNLLKENIKVNGLENKIYALKGDIKNVKNIQNYILNIINRNTVDIITVNPPYKIPNTGIKMENNVKYNSRYETLLSLEDIFKTSSVLLENKGKLFIVHKPERLADLITLSRKYSLEAKKLKFVIPKIGNKPSIVLIEYVKGGGNELVVEEPLIEYDVSGKYTEEMNKIYSIEEGID